MVSAILSFLGGSAFRLIWQQISDWMNARQEHKYELERMRLLADLERAQHERNMESIRIQHEMGVEIVRVQGEARAQELELTGWSNAVSNATAPSGIWIIDFLNGLIRPAAASMAIFLWVCALNAQGFKMTDWDRELVGVILGFYFATRVLIKK